MSHVRLLLASSFLMLGLAFSVPAQVITTQKSDIPLTAMDSRVALAPPGSSGTLNEFTVVSVQGIISSG